MAADKTDLRPVAQLEIDRYGVLRSACLTGLGHLVALSFLLGMEISAESVERAIARWGHFWT
ncbi:MAG: hypothetical protein KY429_09490 [Actinobacteria bacterium]|nr:hypothetical protein [Actinomycetota bacterium]